MAELKFRVYLRRGSGYVELYSIQRSPTGLYLNETRWLLGKGAFSHSYHESGKRWDKMHRKVMPVMKTVDKPLSDYEGQFTLITGVHVVLADADGLPVERVKPRPDDIVLERAGVFGTEIILSDAVIDLPALPDRPNSEVHIKDTVSPVIIIEVFDRPSPELPRGRFPRLERLVEGETLFFDHPGPI